MLVVTVDFRQQLRIEYKRRIKGSNTFDSSEPKCSNFLPDPIALRADVNN